MARGRSCQVRSLVKHSATRSSWPSDVVEAYENVEAYFGAKATWLPMNEDDTQVLRERARAQLDAIDSGFTRLATLSGALRG